MIYPGSCTCGNNARYVNTRAELCCGLCPIRQGLDSIKIMDVPVLIAWCTRYLAEHSKPREDKQVLLGLLADMAMGARLPTSGAYRVMAVRLLKWCRTYLSAHPASRAHRDELRELLGRDVSEHKLRLCRTGMCIVGCTCGWVPQGRSDADDQITMHLALVAAGRRHD